MTNTKKRILFYIISILMTFFILYYSKEYRSRIKENSYISVNTNGKTEKILVLTKFNEYDKILTKKSIRLIELIIKTNFNFNIDNINFYWCVGSDSYGYTLFYDIKPRKMRANIFIDQTLFPERGLFYTQNLVEYGSTCAHELCHYYYLSSEKEMEELEVNISKIKIELLYQKKTNTNFKIKNQLDYLVDKIGLLK